MNPSLYARYIKERLGYGILEEEGGFISFHYPTDKIVYMIDSYVIPEKRNYFFLKKMAETICEQAKEDGKLWAMASVDTTTRNAERSAKVLKNWGMKEYKVVGTMIFYIKPLVDNLENEVVE